MHYPSLLPYISLIPWQTVNFKTTYCLLPERVKKLPWIKGNILVLCMIQSSMRLIWDKQIISEVHISMDRWVIVSIWWSNIKESIPWRLMLEMLQFCLATAEKLPAILHRKTYYFIITENTFLHLNQWLLYRKLLHFPKLKLNI